MIRENPGFILFAGLGLSVLISVSLVAGSFFGGRLVYRYLIGPYGPG
jgi:uncharacterized membrane protein